MTTEQTSQQPTLRKRLGRGLGSLLSTPVQIDIPQQQKPPAQSTTPTVSGAISVQSNSPPNPSPAGGPDDGSSVLMIELDHIQPNPHQPRQHFDEEALEALAKSIKASGV